MLPGLEAGWGMGCERISMDTSFRPEDRNMRALHSADGSTVREDWTQTGRGSSGRLGRDEIKVCTGVNMINIDDYIC
jgi:hypothetical protein